MAGRVSRDLCPESGRDRTPGPHQRASPFFLLYLLVLCVIFFNLEKRGSDIEICFKLHRETHSPVQRVSLHTCHLRLIYSVEYFKQSTRNTPTLSYLCLFCSHDLHTPPPPSGSDLVKQRQIWENLSLKTASLRRRLIHGGTAAPSCTKTANYY